MRLPPMADISRHVVLVTGGRAEVIESALGATLALGTDRAYPGRDKRDIVEAFVARALVGWHARRPIARLIEGWATGADEAAREWARFTGVGDERTDRFPADWTPKPGRPTRTRRDGTRYDPAAGAERNARMLAALVEEAAAGASVAVLAFPGGTGTAGMVRLAHNARVPVWGCTFADPVWRRLERP
jgi:hypothetical protein